MKAIQVDLESGPGFDTVRDMNAAYKPMWSTSLADKPARLTPRQASFYRNLIAIAEVTQSDEIPAVFELTGRGVVFLDRGCIKIAEHAGFVRPLLDGPSSYLETIRLSFDVSGTATAS